MNTPLRDEIRELLVNWMSGEFPDMKIEDDLLNLIASKMPEKKEIKDHKNIGDGTGYYHDIGYNQAITEVKSILKGGTDE
jgi:hypothetical protein